VVIMVLMEVAGQMVEFSYVDRRGGAALAQPDSQ